MSHHAAGVALAFTGLGLCLLASLLAAWSYRRMPGTNAGAALSEGCTVLAGAGAAIAICGAVISHAAA